MALVLLHDPHVIPGLGSVGKTRADAEKILFSCLKKILDQKLCTYGIFAVSIFGCIKRCDLGALDQIFCVEAADLIAQSLDLCRTGKPYLEFPVFRKYDQAAAVCGHTALLRLAEHRRHLPVSHRRIEYRKFRFLHRRVLRDSMLFFLPNWVYKINDHCRHKNKQQDHDFLAGLHLTVPRSVYLSLL